MTEPSRTWFSRFAQRCLLAAGATILVCALPGCGTTKQYEATAQLLASDAVDMAIAKLDFSPLAGQKVFLDTQYLRDHKNVGFVNVQYVTSALRQQMVGAGVLLYDTQDKAEYIVEARLGVLGTDENEIIYGIPQSNMPGAATGVISAVTQVPTISSIPEISFARKKDQMSAVKVALFAYERESRERVWQSGLSVARATAKDTWFMGVGPFQKGTIHDGGVRFAGSRLKFLADKERSLWTGRMGDYRATHVFQRPGEEENLAEPGRVQLAEGTASNEEGSSVEQAVETQPAAEGETP